MRSQCASRGHLASGGVLLGAVAHAPVREAETVLAAAPAEATGRATEWGLKEGLLVSSGGLGARAAGEGTRGKRRSPGFGGALRLSFRRPRAVRGGARLPELRRGG